MTRKVISAVVGLWIAIPAFAQDSAAQDSADRSAFPSSSAPATTTPSNSTVSAKWKHFVEETITPLTLGAGGINGAISQATNSDPRYGTNFGAFAERFGASTADNVTQNFFGDFVMASVFHENVIYTRRGPNYGGIWKRAGYAISRALITRADSGGNIFNWSNVTGTAMSAGFSNLYYPRASRTGEAFAIHFGTSVAGAGFANLYPEFWPDFRAMLRRRHLWPDHSKP